MKRMMLLSLLALLLAGGSARAEQHTLLGNESLENGGMGAFSKGGTMFNGQWVPVSGGRGEWIINHHVGLGGCGYTMHGLPDIQWQGNSYQMEVDYSGFDFEWMVNPDDVVHYNVAMMIGGGHIIAADATNNYIYQRDYFCVMPSGEVEVNVLRWFRIAGGFGYRVMSDVDVVGLDSGDLSGVTTSLTFKFGKF